MVFTKKQARLVETHSKVYDAKAKALKQLQRLKAPGIKRDLIANMANMVSCPYDHSLKRSISGVASTPTICDDNRSYLSRGAILKVPIPLLYQHGGSPIGTVTYMDKSAKQIWISAVIHDSNAGNFAWDMFREGELEGLSCGFEDLHLLAKVDGVSFYNRFTIREISVCRNPANPDCSFHRCVNGKKIEMRDDDAVEQCVIDLMDSGEVEDEDEARARCEEIFGDD